MSSFVLLCPRKMPNPESIITAAGVMDSGLLAALGPGMTR
jgi:hypothetical protein